MFRKPFKILVLAALFSSAVCAEADDPDILGKLNLFRINMNILFML